MKNIGRKKILYAIALLILVVSALFFLKKSPTIHKEKPRDFAEIQKNGQLNVVTNSSSFGFEVKDNALRGFNYEIAKAFADSMGLELIISRQNDLDSCIQGINSGKYDLIAVCLPTIAYLKTKLAFASPFYNSRLMLVQQAYSGDVIHQTIFNHYHLSEDSICIPAASPHRFRLQNLSDEIARPIKLVEIKHKSEEDLVKMVSEGKIKYTVCDELQARKLKTVYPNIDVEMAVGFTQPMAWGVHPQSKELLDSLNDFLKYLFISTDYWAVYRKYF